ncbi:MAG: hypothetical protein WBA46_08070 [Thermomicrobiales bacterium]
MIVHHQQQFQNALMAGPVSALARLQARPLLDRAGKPVVIEGDRMLVAKIQTREGGAMAMLVSRDAEDPDPYADRASGLRRLALTRLAAHLPSGFESVRDGIELDGRTQPATVSAWVNGPSLLDAVVRLCAEANGAVLRALASSTARALNDLRGGAFAHDTFNPGNAIVGEGGAIVFTGLARATWDGGPTPQGFQPATPYRHPDGDGDPFEEDTFAALVTYASLLVLADNPAFLLSEPGPSRDTRPLVFGMRDLADPEASPVFARALAVTTPETREVVDALRSAATQPAQEIERWAAVIPGFRHVELPVLVRTRPGAEQVEHAGPASEASSWGTPSWSQAPAPEPESQPESAWPPFGSRQRDPWESWRTNGAAQADAPASASGDDVVAGWPDIRSRDHRADASWPQEPVRPHRDAERALPARELPSPRPRRADRESVRPAPTAWAAPGPFIPEDEPSVQAQTDLQQARRQFFAALSARDEAKVNAMWPGMAADPVGRTAILAVQDMVGRGYRERIRTEQRQGRHEQAAILAASSTSAGIPIEPELRKRLRAVSHRAMTRERLEAALGANDLDQLAELAVSGELLDLDDTDRQTLQRVLRALKWPGLVSALATDDDQIIVDAFDPDLWDGGRALSAEAHTRIGQAMARIDWRSQVRQALRNRDAESLERLYQRPPTAALDRLSASERRRCRRLIEQRHALGELHRAVGKLDDEAIVRALNHVERVGARIPDRATWTAIQQIVERTSMVEDVIAAVDAVPMDVGKLAHLVPAAKAMGYDRDPRLSGRYALDDLEHVLVRHAHLRRVRSAIEKGDNAGIVLVAVPDPYGSLELLTDAERSRIAQAIQEQRRIDRKGVAARFQATTAG